jgi:hypothetical protein
LTNHFEEQLVVLYKNLETAKAMQSLLSTSSSVKFLSFKDSWRLRPTKATVLMLDPFLKGEESTAISTFSKVASFASRIEYCSLDWRGTESEPAESMFVYPDILGDI